MEWKHNALRHSFISYRVSALAGVDLPVYRDNSGTQAMPNYRVRAAVSWRF